MNNLVLTLVILFMSMLTLNPSHSYEIIVNNVSGEVQRLSLNFVCEDFESVSSFVNIDEVETGEHSYNFPEDEYNIALSKTKLQDADGAEIVLGKGKKLDFGVYIRPAKSKENKIFGDCYTDIILTEYEQREVINSEGETYYYYKLPLIKITINSRTDIKIDVFNEKQDLASTDANAASASGSDED